MITDDKTRNTRTEGVDETVQYHIDPNNVAHISGILRNMYSDPAMAVVREYCANALDAHQMVGKETEPIHVWPPTMLDPWFRVRDFGPGLSREDTERLLFGYGSSGEHKRTSNDQIGGFGIGAKCGFSLSDQFQYEVYHGGLKRTWTCFLDEHDVGRAALLSEEPSDEPTGIMVAVPVPQSQHSTIWERMKQAFRYFPVMPAIQVEGFEAPKLATALATGSLTVTETGREPIQVTWSLTGEHHVTNGNHPVIMFGNAAYELDFNQLPDLDYVVWTKAHSLMTVRSKLWNLLMLRCPIGWLALAPNRESLQYSKNTIRRLTALVKEMLTPAFGTLLGEKAVRGFSISAASCQDRIKIAAQLGLTEALRGSNTPGLRFNAPLGWLYEVAQYLPKDCRIGSAGDQCTQWRWVYTSRRRSYKNGSYWRLETQDTLSGTFRPAPDQARNWLLVLPLTAYRQPLADVPQRFLEKVLAEAATRLESVVFQVVYAARVEDLQSIPAVKDGSLHVLHVSELNGQVQDKALFLEKKPRASTPRNGQSIRYTASGKLFVKWLGTSDDHSRSSSWWGHMPVSELRNLVPEDITFTVNKAFCPQGYGCGKAEGFNYVYGGLVGLAHTNEWIKRPLLGVREEDVQKLPPQAKEFKARIRDIVDAHFKAGDVSPEAADFWISLGEYPLFWKQILHTPKLRKQLAPLWKAARQSAKKAPGLCRWLQEYNRKCEHGDSRNRADGLLGSLLKSPVSAPAWLDRDERSEFNTGLWCVKGMTGFCNAFGIHRTRGVQHVDDCDEHWLPALPAMVSLRTVELTKLMHNMIAKEPQLFAATTGAISVSVLLAEPLWAPKFLVKWWNEYYDATRHEKYADRVCIPYLSLPLMERRNFLDNRRSS